MTASRRLWDVFAEPDQLKSEPSDLSRLDTYQMPVTPALKATLTATATDLAAATKAREEAVQACRRAVTKAHTAGMTEVELAALMGVNRLTIRRWLGK